MIRHRMRRPALILVAGLLAVLTLFVSNPTLPGSTSTVRPAPDGPSVLTDAQGRFRFDGLHSASHILRVDPQSLPPGVRSDAASLALTLSPGVTRSLAVAPGLALRATYHDDGKLLDGALFHDQNGDGVQSAGEPGLTGVRVIDPDVYQYFVPFQNGNLIQSFNDVLNAPCLNLPSTSPIIDSRIALTSSSTPTIIYYDQWEDGYDADPTVPGPTTEVLTLNSGQTKIWHDSLTTPHTPPYDGRDRITIVGQPASLIRAAWLNDPGTRLAGAWEMPKVSDWGRHYVIPVGEDIGRGGPQNFGDFDYVSVSVMAAYDNTSVTVVTDPTNPSTTTTTYTLNAGQTVYVRGSANQAPISVRSGATVDSTLPVQVQVRAGNCRAAYSGRSYSLVPVERWSNDYWSPVSSFFAGANNCLVRYLQTQPNASADVDIYIYNPGAAPLPITYEDASGTGVFTIPPRSTGSYLNLHPKPIVRTNMRGVHLTAPGPFSAVTAVDSTSLGNDGADFDWSYTLVPAKDLSSRVVLSWAPGTNPPPAPPPGQVNGSTAYVQATADGTLVRADLNGDGVPDQFDTDGNGVLSAASNYGYNELTSNQGITLNKGQMVRISNPTTHDMTGAIIYSQDNNHQLAAVWGEDACIAGPQAPFLDLGYTVLPLPVPEISKNSRLLIDADRSGDISPGDTLEYKIQITNNGVGPIEQPILIDTLPYTYTDYLLGTMTSVPAPIAPGFTYDNGNGLFNYVPPARPTGTPDPQVRAIKAPFNTIPAGGSVVVTLHIILDRQIPTDVLAVINKADLTSSNAPPVSTHVTTPINQVDLLIHKTDGRTVVNPGDQLTYTLTYTNAGPGVAHNVVMTDTLPAGATNVSTPTRPGVITPTLDLPRGRIYFQLGTLQPGQVGQTTVTLTLANPTSDQVVNTVDIDTSSSETNKSNNHSVDIDQLPPADLQISKTDGRQQAEPGDQLTYTVTYTNAGPGIAFDAVITDTLPPTALNVSTPTVPGVITPTIQPGRIIFQLGTLRPGHVGKTTITLTLGPNTTRGQDVINSVEISSKTRDPNPGNNRGRDVDKVPNPSAVVLSDLGAERQAGGVRVYWRTIAEQDNYGFRVYRGRTPSRAGAELITPQIIPGQGRGRADGASYSFFDAGAPDGPLYYWIEDIDLNGISEFHGPAQPTIQGARIHILVPFVAAGR
jgi:uncharacterized repeat protein (TIGR01451 family)